MAQNAHKDTDKFLGAYYILQEENSLFGQIRKSLREMCMSYSKQADLAINHIYQQSAFVLNSSCSKECCMKDPETSLIHKALLVGSGGEATYTNFKVTKGIKNNGKRKRENKKRKASSCGQLGVIAR